MYALVKLFSGKGGILWKCEIYPYGSPHVIRYLFSGHKKRSYNRIWWKNSWSAYLTLKNYSRTPCNTISSMVNVCIRYVIFWTKWGISPVGFITCIVMRYLSAGYKKGGKSLYDKLTHGVLISCSTTATARSSYLTLKIDSYTTWNMISSIVNVHSCFTIILAKSQSSVNTVYLKKDIEGSPLIIWLCDNGCVWTYYLLSLLNLRKGSYSIISGNNSQSAYRTLQNESHTLLGELKNYSYTPCFAAWSKRNVCKSLIGSYSLIFRNDFGVFIWLQHNTLCGLIDSECMHIPCHFMDKNGESFDNKMRNLQLG